MRKSKLDPYEGLIRDLVVAGASNGQVREALRLKGCSVSLESVRTWVLRDNHLRGRNRKRGRPRKMVGRLLPILPECLPKHPGEISLPFAFRLFLDPSAYQLTNYQVVAGELGIPGCESSRDLSDKEFATWARQLGEARVRALVDFDYCLIAFWCTDLPSFPAGAYRDAEDWFHRLAFEACRIRGIMRRVVGLPFA